MVPLPALLSYLIYPTSLAAMHSAVHVHPCAILFLRVIFAPQRPNAQLLALRCFACFSRQAGRTFQPCFNH